LHLKSGVDRQEKRMVFDVGVALTWILFLALFPMAFFWLRRTWRILVRRDFSEVALKGGEPPSEPARWAPYAMAINGVAGIVVLMVIVWVVLGAVPYETWTAIAGTTIWCKFFLDFALSRQAHAKAAARQG
jgi:small-conductance mechanosensitive channel